MDSPETDSPEEIESPKRRRSRRRRREKDKEKERETLSERLTRAAFFIVGAILIVVITLGSFLIGRYLLPAKKEATPAADSGETQRVRPPVVRTDTASRRLAMEKTDLVMKAAAEGDYETALSVLGEIERIDPTLPGVGVQKAIVLENMGKLVDAAVELDSSEAKEDHLEEVFILRARWLGEQGTASAAIQNISKAAEISPFSVQPFFHWGMLLRKEGKQGEALVQLRRALLRSTLTSEEFLLNLAVALTRVEAQDPDVQAEVQEGLAAEHPAADILVLAAARAVSENRFADAAPYLERLRAMLPPAYYNWLISDPFWSICRDRPELQKLLSPD